jgi:hypothetical protein
MASRTKVLCLAGWGWVKAEHDVGISTSLSKCFGESTASKKFVGIIHDAEREGSRFFGLNQTIDGFI